tara:strand:+ start:214 stop:630 length:417 start_codon:yes stop_codon:yes gene_type:complete
VAVISVENSLLLIRNHLLSNSSITNIVSDRVLTDHFYDFDNTTVQMPLIILDIEGGSANYGMEAQAMKMDVYCYSKTSSSQTVSLYDALYLALHAQRLSNDGIPTKGYAYETERPDTGYNNQIRAWYSMGKYTVNLAG